MTLDDDIMFGFDSNILLISSNHSFLFFKIYFLIPYSFKIYFLIFLFFKNLFFKFFYSLKFIFLFFYSLKIIFLFFKRVRFHWKNISIIFNNFFFLHCVMAIYRGWFLLWIFFEMNLSYLPTPPLGQDMTQGQFLNGV